MAQKTRLTPSWSPPPVAQVFGNASVQALQKNKFLFKPNSAIQGQLNQQTRWI